MLGPIGVWSWYGVICGCMFESATEPGILAPAGFLSLRNIETKAEIFAKHGGKAENTGSAEGQIALFTFRISHLTEHLKKNRHDFNTERSLVLLVGKRRSLLDYLKKKDINRYREIIKELNIRK